MIHPRHTREPHCPGCLQRLTLTFVGRRTISCPECGVQVSAYEASRHMPRRRFFAVCLASFWFTPLFLALLMNETMQAELDYPDIDYRNPLFLIAFTTFLHQVLVPLYMGRFMLRHWLYLKGVRRKPSGRVLILVCVSGWIITTTLIVICSFRFALYNTPLW
jgi:uncharacterized integral membrane protein